MQVFSKLSQPHSSTIKVGESVSQKTDPCLSSKFFTDFELQNNSHDPQLPMQIELQQSMVNILMAEKVAVDANGLTITHHDITKLLNELEKKFPDVESNCNKAIQFYRTKPIETLLTEGTAAYNQEKNTNIKITTQPTDLPDELFVHLGGYLSWNENRMLALASKRHYLVQNNESAWSAKLDGEKVKKSGKKEPSEELFKDVELRKSKYAGVGLEGKEYLTKLGITDPILIKRGGVNPLLYFFKTRYAEFL